MAIVKQPELSKDIKNTQDVRTFVFKARVDKKPEDYNKFYNIPAYGGISPCIQGNTDMGSYTNALSVLPNCVGYACGRFSEISCDIRGLEPNILYPFNMNAGQFINYAPTSNFNLKTGNYPKLGAIICWSKNGGAGHVGIVEKINSDGSIITSESGWMMGAAQGSTFNWTNYTRKHGSDGKWIDGCPWMESSRNYYSFQGFIYNPDVPEVDNMPIMTWVDQVYDTPSQSGAFPEDVVNQPEYEEVTESITRNGVKSLDYAGEHLTKSTSLLTFPTNVETPFIILKVGDYTFGSYNSIRNGRELNVSYPNFIRGMEVVKVNGRLNQYTIQLVYQVQAGNDPNLLDKIFGSVGYGNVEISYGDYSFPTIIYKKEQAIITNLNSIVDFASAKITYTLSCTSTALGLISNTYTFPATRGKPSDIIYNMLTNDGYGLKEIFTGMTDISRVKRNHWIATNDKVVNLNPKTQTDPITYINYLVSCMIADTNGEDDILLDSSYYMTIVDDTYGEQGGPYFTIKQIKSNIKTLSHSDTYEVDVGFPTDANVTNFTINTDNSWALLYKYSGELDKQNYVYEIANDGKVLTTYSPAYSTSSVEYNTSAPQRNWWTQVTKFPVSATLTLKGLLRPAMLMTTVRINAFFYGKRHIASGLYFVTKQVDRVDGSGYRTTLTLVRFAGDDDYMTKVEEQATYKRLKGTAASTASNDLYIDYKKRAADRAKSDGYLQDI